MRSVVLYIANTFTTSTNTTYKEIKPNQMLVLLLLPLLMHAKSKHVVYYIRKSDFSAYRNKYNKIKTYLFREKN